MKSFITKTLKPEHLLTGSHFALWVEQLNKGDTDLTVVVFVRPIVPCILLSLADHARTRGHRSMWQKG